MLAFLLRVIQRRKAMAHEINGFIVEPSTSSHRHLFRRVTEPRHEYVFWISPDQVVLRATLPDDVGLDREDALEDAERSEKDAKKAAEEFQRRMFGSGLGCG
jgi:hypothetical protein